MGEPVSARSRLEEGMVDECRIEVPASGPTSLNAETLEVTGPEPDVIYEGPCMVTARQVTTRQAERGGETEYHTRYRVSVPYDAATIPVGATVVILESESDPELPDSRFVVRQSIVGTRAARRRLECDLVEVGPR